MVAMARRGVSASALRSTSYFAPLVGPLLVKSALWSGDPTGAGEHLAAIEASGFRGPALSADLIVARAGIDALNGRSTRAVAGYRDALRACRGLGLAFDEAAAVVDLATLLPAADLAAPDLQAAIASARETLQHLGARPFLDRLEAVGTRH